MVRNINYVFGPGTTNERKVEQLFHKFRDRDESPEDQAGRRLHSATDNEELKALIETDLRTTVRWLAD